MISLLPKLDGMRARIAAALLAAMLVQFFGSEMIFARIEASQLERSRAQRLADWLSFADEFATTRPDALDRMTALWRPDLVVRHAADPLPGTEHPRETVRQARVEELVVTLRPQLQGRDFRAIRDGDNLEGSMRLTAGGWLTFKAGGYFQGRSQMPHYLSSLVLLIISVIAIAMVFGRMIARPLARISEAAERVGRDEEIAIKVEGPREVRQVAAAFDRMQARLLAHVGEREQSLAAISHDLRTPLARMKLNASVVADAENRKALQNDISEMEAFVASVLDYLQGDEAEPIQRADAASIVMTVVDEVTDLGGVVAYHGPDRLELETRPLKLKRLVRNLVQNASRYGGDVVVSLDSGPDQMVIVIEDDGPGIPEDQIDAVFEPFRRLDLARGKEAGGTGLGLAIARRLAHTLGGTITLRNKTEGGLSATVRLKVNAQS